MDTGVFGVSNVFSGELSGSLLVHVGIVVVVCVLHTVSASVPK